MKAANARAWVVVLMLGTAGAAQAELGVQLGVENFRWREFNADGTRLLEERGPRLQVGGEWRLALGEQREYLLQLRGALYLGSVEYDGQACVLGGSCAPYMNDSNYFGSVVETTIARRYGVPTGTELFAGAGADNWRRDIQGSAEVQGAVEDWTVLYLLAGGGAYWTGPALRYHARAGLKWPFYTYEVPNLYDVSLEPEGRASLFVRLAVDVLRDGRAQWGIGLYYDRYRFDASDRERSGSVLVWQPQSHQDVIGIYGALYLQ